MLLPRFISARYICWRVPKWLNLQAVSPPLRYLDGRERLECLFLSRGTKPHLLHEFQSSNFHFPPSAWRRRRNAWHPGMPEALACTCQAPSSKRLKFAPEERLPKAVGVCRLRSFSVANKGGNEDNLVETLNRRAIYHCFIVFACRRVNIGLFVGESFRWCLHRLDLDLLLARSLAISNR